MLEGCLVLWSRYQSRHMLQGGREGNDGAEWLSYLARAARAGASAGARAAGGAGAGWRDSEVSRGSRQTEEAWTGCVDRGRYRMNRWYSSDGITRPTTWRGGGSPGRHVDLMEIKVLSDSRGVCVFGMCLVFLDGWYSFQEVWEMRTFVDRKDKRRRRTGALNTLSPRTASFSPSHRIRLDKTTTRGREGAPILHPTRSHSMCKPGPLQEGR